jgi:hypothetical protein
MSDMDQFDRQALSADEAKMLTDIFGNRVRRGNQAAARVVRSRPTQNPRVNIVDVRGRSDMATAEEELREALIKYAGVQSLLGRWSSGEPPKGSVLRWVQTFTDRNVARMTLNRSPLDEEEDAFSFEVSAPTEYIYVAIRANDGRWYVSGTREHKTYSWDALVKKIDDAPCQVVSKWEEVPVPQKPREESLDPETWARQMFGPKPVTDDPGTTNS